MQSEVQDEASREALLDELEAAREQLEALGPPTELEADALKLRRKYPASDLRRLGAMLTRLASEAGKGAR